MKTALDYNLEQFNTFYVVCNLYVFWDASVFDPRRILFLEIVCFGQTRQKVEPQE
jgi:hypothetical protein